MHGMRREERDRHEAEDGHRQPDRQISNAIMPVMTVADASTMPIWKAAEATS